MITRRCALAVAGLAFVLTFPPALLAQEYDIRLTFESKRGEKYRMSAAGGHRQRMNVLVGNVAVNEQKEEFSVDLLATVTVIGTNESGRTTKLALAIEKCLITSAGTTRPLIESGVVLTAATEGNRVILKINETPVDPPTAKALSVVIPSHDPGITDDEVFGTRERKRVGDSWEINTNLVARELKDQFNLSINKGEIKGASTLDGVVKGGDGDYLVVSAWLGVDNFFFPLPEGMKVHAGQVKGEFTGRFPIDPARRRVAHSTKTAMWFSAVRDSDTKTQLMTLQGLMERSVSREITPLQ